MVWYNVYVISFTVPNAIQPDIPHHGLLMVATNQGLRTIHLQHLQREKERLENPYIEEDERALGPVYFAEYHGIKYSNNHILADLDLPQDVEQEINAIDNTAKLPIFSIPVLLTPQQENNALYYLNARYYTRQFPDSDSSSDSSTDDEAHSIKCEAVQESNSGSSIQQIQSGDQQQNTESTTTENQLQPSVSTSSEPSAEKNSIASKHSTTRSHIMEMPNHLLKYNKKAISTLNKNQEDPLIKYKTPLQQQLHTPGTPAWEFFNGKEYPIIGHKYLGRTQDPEAILDSCRMIARFLMGRRRSIPKALLDSNGSSDNSGPSKHYSTVRLPASSVGRIGPSASISWLNDVLESTAMEGIFWPDQKSVDQYSREEKLGDVATAAVASDTPRILINGADMLGDTNEATEKGVPSKNLVDYPYSEEMVEEIMSSGEGSSDTGTETPLTVDERSGSGTDYDKSEQEEENVQKPDETGDITGSNKRRHKRRFRSRNEDGSRRHRISSHLRNSNRSKEKIPTNDSDFQAVVEEDDSDQHLQAPERRRHKLTRLRKRTRKIFVHSDDLASQSYSSNYTTTKPMNNNNSDTNTNLFSSNESYHCHSSNKLDSSVKNQPIRHNDKMSDDNKPSRRQRIHDRKTKLKEKLKSEK